MKSVSINSFLFLSLLLLCLCSYSTLKAVSSNPQSDKTNQTQETDLNKKEVRIIQLLDFFQTKRRSSSDSAKIHLREAQQLIDENVRDSISTKVYLKLIEKHLIVHEYDSCFFYVNVVRNLSEKTPNQFVTMLNMEGTAYYYIAKYDNALTSHHQALKICEENDFEKQKARVYNNLGISYIKMEDWTKAEEYMSQAFQVTKKFQIKRGELYCLGNLAIIYKNQNQYEKAIEAYNKSIQINEEMDDQAALARNYNNLGALYEHINQLQDAAFYCQKGLDIGVKLNDQNLIAHGHQSMASVYTKRGKFLAAENAYIQVIELADSLKSDDLRMTGHEGLSDLYEQMGQYKKSLKHRKNYVLIKDSVLNETKLKDINELEIKYQSEKSEKEILALEKQKIQAQSEMQLKEANLSKLRSSLFGAILLFASIIIIYRQYINNRQKQQQLKTVSETQNIEQKRIAQDLHDSVGGSLASIKTKIQTLVDDPDADKAAWDEVSEQLSATAAQLRQISHNIMPGELLRFGLASAVQTLVNKLNENGKLAHLYAFGMDKRLDPSLEINIYRIIQEGIQNILKHAHAKTINIHLNRHGKNLDLLIEDDGNGFETESKTGLGLASIQDRVKSMNGTYHLDSSEGKGTTMSIKVPL